MKNLDTIINIFTNLNTIEPLQTYLKIDTNSILLKNINKKYNKNYNKNNKLKVGGSNNIPSKIDITKLKILENIPNKNNINKDNDKNEINLIYNNSKYKFNIYHDNDNIFYRLYPKDINDECIFIIVSKKYKICEIHNISYNSKCIPKIELKNNGSTLLKIALKLFDTIKDKYKLKYIQLTDNSNKICNGKKLKLNIMITLLTGITWYGKYGFYPKDKIILKKYLKNKEIIENTKLTDIPILKDLIIKAHKKSNSKIDLTKILRNYDKSQNDNILLKKYLHYFLLDYDKLCIIFYYFYRELHDLLNLTDMYGQPFIKNISHNN